MLLEVFTASLFVFELIILGGIEKKIRRIVG